MSCLILLCKGLNAFIRPRAMTYLEKMSELRNKPKSYSEHCIVTYIFLFGKVDDIVLPVCRTTKVR